MQEYTVSALRVDQHYVVSGFSRTKDAAAMRIARFLVLTLVICANSGAVGAQSANTDWPQFRGPNRDGASSASEADWPAQLTKGWSAEVGNGHATPLVVGGRVFVFARQGDQEVMHAFDAGTGKAVWQTRYPAPVTVNPAAKDHGAGPKSTPTFAEGRLYSLGMGGTVTAFEASSGRIVWQQPGGAVLPLYGTAASPLVDGGLVIVHVGGNDRGALTAFDAATGKTRWSWNGDGPSYGSPVVAAVGGTRQVITLTQANLVGVSATSGQLLWRRPYTTEYTQNIITPVVAGQTVIISGYQKPLSALRIVRAGDQWRVEDVWENPTASLYMADLVVVGNRLFGMTHRNSGQYFLLDAATGKTVWTGPPRQAENAAIVRTGQTVVALEDDGELMVGRVEGNVVKELRRYTVSKAATWAQPVLSGSRVFIKDVSTVTLWTRGS